MATKRLEGTAAHSIDGIRVNPCVGSGYCCMTAPCWVAMRIHGINALMDAGRCPELRWDDDDSRYYCRAAENDEKVRAELGAGITGCCSSLNTYRQDVRDRPEILYNQPRVYAKEV